nr:hypothetical protein [uncultured Pedobacter sp.]
MNAANCIATIGVGILLLGFFLNIAGKISAKHKLYSLLNLIGGILSAYASWIAHFYPFVALNIVWSITALTFLLKASVPRETK